MAPGRFTCKALTIPIVDNIQINPGHFALLTALLNGMGKSVKEIPSVPNYYIPFILIFTGGIGYALMAGWTSMNVMVGVVSAFSAIGLHQGARQAVEVVKKPDDKET